MQRNFQDPEVLDKFIRNQVYKKDAQFNKNSKNLIRLIEYVEDLPIDMKSFPIIQNLLKFYGFPLFICLKTFFENLKKNLKFQGQKQVMDIAAFVKQYLGTVKLEELQFFFCFGTSKKKYNINQRSKQERQFIEYVTKLSKHLSKLKHKTNPKDLKRQIQTLLAQGIERKLNSIELYYENYFKRQADKIYQQYKKTIQQQDQEYQYQPMHKGLQRKPQVKDQKPDPICCRQFFYDGEIIKEPENLVLQYKNYSFPFDQKRIGILKKTICAFLNTNGGIIFIGIHEHIETKKRTVRGLILNQSQQQNFLKQITKIAKNIQPSIIGNKIYQVKFVPIKKDRQPYNYISGKFLAKIIIGYGKRDDIYSYCEKDTDMFSFRTENQVIHRSGRQILNILRERIKNPLPIPDPVHQGPCKIPQIGSRIYDKPQNYRNIQSRRQNHNYNHINNNNGNNSRSNNNKSYQKSYQNSYQKKKQKTKYKQRDAMDYLVLGMKQNQLQGIINKNDLNQYIQLNSKSKEQICFLKVKNKTYRQKVQILATVLQCQDVKFQAIQRGILLRDIQGYQCDIVYDSLECKKIIYHQQGNVFKFRSAQDAIEAYLIIKGFQFPADFVAV